MDREQRRFPPTDADERTTLLAYLDYHRDTLRIKTAGLDAAQLDTPHPPSDLTLGGLLKHLAYVENWWFRAVMAGHADEPWASVDWAADEDWDWHSAKDDSPAQLRDLFDAEVDRADAVIASYEGLDAVAARPNRRTGGYYNLRWIVLHMIEEYARHNGHADLIRQAVDGAVGE
ncbi:DinB family protein [Nocardioides sp. cx-169]|uniref:DinB family protein n=1 Tax=Nocardioides sp. cx-169 TaxID=2899080 RepID=UPI001E2F1441|nr:DinB family protein [Nocardioides sp. cx-169]MCD4536401.1 DinB family protein [Nocardioides sp. cx-169]